ncbi:unnamed protein product [Soboliphyme baturini]|uniref:Uncharacterized protein n=1 Tax=Soboliphyme baturini TaxID=241478 RepID=A0A183J7N1_9BILA|nr:unnamed protein product [Soboliphyme baturini]
MQPAESLAYSLWSERWPSVGGRRPTTLPAVSQSNAYGAERLAVDIPPLFQWRRDKKAKSDLSDRTGQSLVNTTRGPTVSLPSDKTYRKQMYPNPSLTRTTIGHYAITYAHGLRLPSGPQVEKQQQKRENSPHLVIAGVKDGRKSTVITASTAPELDP